MRRRAFITLLGGAAAAWPLAARGQQQTTIRKVGLLHSGASTVVNMRVAAIREGLSVPDNQRDLSLEIIVRLADGDVSRLPALATDLVNNRVDAIVAAAPPAVQAAASATNSIPVIAIDLESDPIASGFVRSLARPGGNVTGVFLNFPDFSAKCLQLLIESVPTLSGVSVLWDPSTGALQLKAVEAAAQGFGIVVQVFEAQRAADIAEAFYVADRSRIQGLLLLSSPLVAGNPQLIADLAIRRNVPTISLFPEIARAGGLLGFGPEIQDLFRHVGGMARKVLVGAEVAELPAERPTRFKLLINLKTAKALGLEVPPTLLGRADEGIARRLSSYSDRYQPRQMRTFCTNTAWEVPAQPLWIHASFARHSITSSARASSHAGTSRPSVLAVCRLITNSNLVGRRIGRSAGFSPLRMRPV